MGGDHQLGARLAKPQRHTRKQQEEIDRERWKTHMHTCTHTHTHTHNSPLKSPLTTPNIFIACIHIWLLFLHVRCGVIWSYEHANQLHACPQCSVMLLNLNTLYRLFCSRGIVDQCGQNVYWLLLLSRHTHCRQTLIIYVHMLFIHIFGETPWNKFSIF